MPTVSTPKIRRTGNLKWCLRMHDTSTSTLPAGQENLQHDVGVSNIDLAFGKFIPTDRNSHILLSQNQGCEH